MAQKIIFCAILFITLGNKLFRYNYLSLHEI